MITSSSTPARSSSSPSRWRWRRAWDGVVTVIRAHAESRGVLQRMRDSLKQIKAEHLGVVLNAVRAQGGGYYRSNIKAYYDYQNAA